jgi:glutamine cyclotransferase
MKIKIVLIFAAFIVVCFTLIFLFTKENEKINESNNKLDPNFFETQKADVIIETNDYSVLKKIKKNPKIFTEGLFMDSEDTIIESGGLYGESLIIKYSINDPDNYIFRQEVNNKYFSEGISIFKDKLYMLTYQEKEMYTIYN